jgi:CheY-like chemotaxis protein
MSPTVLLAEADVELRDIYTRFLSRYGFDVQVAECGFECITKLRLFTPDLLILDVHLPVGGAEEVLAMMRKNPHAYPVPVILTLVACANLDRLAASPVVRVLTKPFPLKALLESVTKMTLSRSRADEPTGALQEC